MLQGTLMEVIMPYGQLKKIYQEKGEATLLELFQNTFRGLKVYGFSKEWITNKNKYMTISGENGKIVVKW